MVRRRRLKRFLRFSFNCQSLYDYRMERATVEKIAKLFGIARIRTTHTLNKGKVHETYQLETNEGTFVLQRLRPPYNEKTILDGAALTSHLLNKGFPVPSFLITPEGLPFITEGAFLYRMMTFIPGQTLSAINTVEAAASAGELVGQLHNALSDFTYSPLSTITGFHDLRSAMERLNGLVNNDIEKIKKTEGLFDRFNHEIQKQKLPENLPKRKIHGDLKYTNILFDDFSRAVALLDFDTLMISTLPIELGDAFRSWCTRKKGPAGPFFDVKLFEAGWRGYMLVNPPITALEKANITAGIKYILLELGCRYLIDMFENYYFAWDSQRFSDRSSHNLARAKRQIAVYDDVVAKEQQLQRLIENVK